MTGEDFKAFFRQLASGVCVVTLWADERMHGFTATSVTSVSMVPPVALFCVAQRSESFAHIQRGGLIGVSILSKDQRHLSNRFAEKAGPGGYNSIHTVSMAGGVPTLEGALGQLAGRVSEILPIGDHAAVLIKIQETRTKSGKMPLLHFKKKYYNIKKKYYNIPQ